MILKERFTYDRVGVLLQSSHFWHRSFDLASLKISIFDSCHHPASQGRIFERSKGFFATRNHAVSTESELITLVGLKIRDQQNHPGKKIVKA